MDWITNQVAIGDYIECKDAELLRRVGVRSVLGLMNALRGVSPEKLGVKFVCIVPLIDGPGNEVRHFCEAIDTLELLVKDAPPVLVHCRAGRSRSPAVVAGYLMRVLGLGAGEALARVAAKRESFVVPELRVLLERLED